MDLVYVNKLTSNTTANQQIRIHWSFIKLGVLIILFLFQLLVPISFQGQKTYSKWIYFACMSVFTVGVCGLYAHLARLRQLEQTVEIRLGV